MDMIQAISSRPTLWRLDGDIDENEDKEDARAARRRGAT